MWKSLAVAVLLTGCIPPPSPPVFGPQAGAQPQGAAAPPAGSSCIEIVQCLSTCGQDTSCFPACVDGGDAQAQQDVNALLACNAASPDACGAELDACRGGPVVAAASAADTSLAPGQPHATADLVPWLTGEWIGSNHQFTFHGDGRVRRAEAIALAYRKPGERTYDHDCVSTRNEEGTVTQEGDLLIMVFDDSQTSHCGAKNANAALTVRYQIEWIDNPYDQDPGLQLRLRDLDCTRGDMFCLDSMTRR